MRKFIYTLLFIILGCQQGFTQLVNYNPDPNGDPWWAGSFPPADSINENTIEELPFLTRKSFVNPGCKIDNSEEKFMRPIFLQKHSCCAQASGVGYIFTYEMNWLRNLDASDTANIEYWYPTHFTYNFLNFGDSAHGSFIYDGWKIIQESGCPNVIDYGGNMCLGPKYWMTGYNNYKNALSNRIDSIFKIDFSDSEDGLIIIKQWLFNHNSDTCQVGGLVSFVTNLDACNFLGVIPQDSPEAGKHILKDWDNPGELEHQFTVVGFNDSIKYDFNNDGHYTNDIDINGDSIVDMQDWEIGAIKLANSWGSEWPFDIDSGFVYWPYKFLAVSEAITDEIMYVCTVKEYQPDISLRVKAQNEERDKIRFDVDFGVDANSEPPASVNYYYKAFGFNGGAYPFLGLYGQNDPMEIELDYGMFFENLDTLGKVFFDFWQGVDEQLNGYLNEFSLVDYRWNEEFVLPSGYSNTPIDYMFNWFSIEYDLIVPGNNQQITQDDTLYSNMVSRFNPTVSNSSALTISNGVKIDMYNSSIIINEGSSLIIGDSVTFTGKRGTNKLIINGNITIGNNVVFQGIDEIRLNNNNLQTTFNKTIFSDTTILINYGEELTIDSSSWLNRNSGWGNEILPTQILVIHGR